jgi:very-short-patch-repair endonuclease
MGLSLLQIKQALGEKAYQQAKAQIKKAAPAKNSPAAKLAKLRKITPAEEALYALLVEVFEPQYLIEREVCLCKAVGRAWRSDFVIKELRVSIEIDGWQYHGKHLESFKNDRDKSFEVFLQGYVELRIYASQAMKEPDQVRSKLIKAKVILEKRLRGEFEEPTK